MIQYLIHFFLTVRTSGEVATFRMLGNDDGNLIGAASLSAAASPHNKLKYPLGAVPRSHQAKVK